MIELLATLAESCCACITLTLTLAGAPSRLLCCLVLYEGRVSTSCQTLNLLGESLLAALHALLWSCLYIDQRGVAVFTLVYDQ